MSIRLSSFNHCLRIVGWRSVPIMMRVLLTGTPVEVSVPVNDGDDLGVVTPPVLLRLGTTDVATFKQIFVREEYGWDPHCDPACIIDAGANIGLASIYFARRYPQARIFSIEPELANFELLRHNVAPYPNVTPLHAALWKENTHLELVDPGLGEWGFQTKEAQDELDSGQVHPKVPAMTIDRLMETYDIPQIDLLKIDIEGAEIEVLANSRSWMPAVHSMMVELHERFQSGCESAFASATTDFDIRETRGPIECVSRRSIKGFSLV